MQEVENWESDNNDGEVAIVVSTSLPPQSKGLTWFIPLISVSLFVTALCIVLLRPNDESNQGGRAAVDRQAYYNYLLETYSTPMFGTPQEKAIGWLAFQDEPLTGAEISRRLDQRYALVVLYFAHDDSATWNSVNEDSTAGGWIYNGVGLHECEWKGVDCKFQQVTGLRLSSQDAAKLTGSQVSTEIGLLSNLQSLYMADQRLQGSIPSEWKTLTNLMILDLSNNEIRSTIPTFFGEMKNLRALLLGGNLLSGSIPETLEDSNLERLEVQRNLGIEGRIEGLLTFLPTLTYLDVSSTSVSGFLPAMEVEKLQELHAWASFLTGTIPSEIGKWSNLNFLDLGQSYMIGTIPPEFALLTNLEALKLSYLSMTGTLPTELSRMESLTLLELQGSSFSGSLPTEYSRLSNLVSLDLAYNAYINGTVPREYGNMESLRNILLQGTSLSGTIGPEICSLHLLYFTVDCAEKQKEIDCSCCTECFDLP